MRQVLDIKRGLRLSDSAQKRGKLSLTKNALVEFLFSFINLVNVVEQYYIFYSMPKVLPALSLDAAGSPISGFIPLAQVQ
jgi:hypothetical protein